MTEALILQDPAQGGGTKAAQLILLLHGVGSNAQSMVGLGQAYARSFPNAMVVALNAPEPFMPGTQVQLAGHQWFSIHGVTEDNRPARVTQALPAFEALVRHWQQRSGVDAAGTALVGFSQGAIMALAAAMQPEPVAARTIAIAGRFAALPEAPPHESCTIHLLHGKSDAVMPYRHAIEGPCASRNSAPTSPPTCCPSSATNCTRT
ncbi:esterase [Hylemonella gracilis]|uniref:esterase n=1 Tax=Hylemonella gracilis TaxID=80880 RepID=UPI001F61D3E5|nr:esterase [Hylemonella gracilis]